MAYVSLYRKYRPQTFEDVVGQEHVTTTLRNAIAEGRVASGYLFTGTRGTAKTTCARIVAKALNCIGPDETRTTPTPEPCGVCGPCQSIAASNFVDVLEMDAASHGKVDDVRDLVASIKFPPMEGRYKVYIIDEAHQLSRDAMDAFLKTLEEPPDRVVFILATTELEKLPITIASRCQVFEFKRGSVSQIAARLSQVLAAEDVQAEPAAVTLIARAADGSYRDSLSLLEQVLAYKRTGITVRDTTAVLGAIDEDVLSRVVDLVAASDAAAAFAAAADILESGKDVRQFLKSLSGRMRDLLFVGVGAHPTTVGELDDSPELRRQAALFSPAALLQALQILTEAEQETKRSNQHRLLLEMALLRLIRLPQSASAPAPYVTPAITAQPAPPVVIPATVVPKPAPARPSPEPQVAPPIEARPAPAPAPNPPFREDPVSEANKEVGLPEVHLPQVSLPEAASLLDIAPPLLEDELPDTDLSDSDLSEDDEPSDLDVPLPGDDDLDVPLPLDEETPTPPGLGAGGPLTAPSFLVTSAAEHDAADDFLQVQQVADVPAPVNGNGHKPEPRPDDPPELLQLQKNWQEVINRMSSRSPAGSVLVKDAHPVALFGHTFTLEFQNPLFVDKLEKNEKAGLALADIICKTLGVEPGAYKVKAVLKGTLLPAKVAISSAPKVRETVAAPDAHQHSPFLDEVIAVFGGQVLDDPDVKG